MPVFTNLFQNKNGSSNRSSTSLAPIPPVCSTPTPSSPLRPNISAPIPAPGSALYGHPTIPTQSRTNRQTIHLVSAANEPAIPSPLTPAPGSRGGAADFTAEQHQQRTFQQLNGSGSNSDLLNDTTYNASSSSSSTSASVRREANPTAPTGRKPGGFNLGTVFGGAHRDRDRSSALPGSPQPTGGGLGRRISVRHKPAAPPPPEALPYHQHQATQLDPYLQQAPHSRPHSVLPSPRENEVIDYSLQRGGEQPTRIQRHNSFSQASHHSRQQQQQQYYDPGQEYHQQQSPHTPLEYHQQQPPHTSLEYQIHHQQIQQPPQQQQQQQQEEHMMPVGQHNQSRPSGDALRGPPSREPSGLSLQQPQPYVRSGDHGQGQGASGGGGQPPNQPYDPSKFDEQGRSTPEQRTQSRSGEQSAEQMALVYQQTLQELETLQGKYRKVKSLYFERSAEIERLQNTLAHQRLAQSRTSLDDNEYTQRFERLDGAIKNVAFEIRQSWKTIPAWLSNVINLGAAAKGGREMTVVGRASISRWVVDEILERFFHPALDPVLSVALKDIERNIRMLAPLPQTAEDDDALSVKVCNWRLTTLDAMQTRINSPQALEARQKLAEDLVNRLVSQLKQHLHEPPPGLLGGVQMVVDIAIGLAANMPIESRDVRVCYPLPGERFDSKFMKGEGGLPPLGTPASTSEPEKMQTDNNSNNSGEGSEEAAAPPAPAKDSNPSSRAGVAGLPAQQQQQQKAVEKKSTGFSGRVKKALHGNTTMAQPQAPPSPGLPPVNNGKQQQSGEQQQQNKGSDGDKIRVAGFMAVEVRGRSILVKAPVWL